MSLFLAIDTATDYGSVAVGEPGDVAVELLFASRRHAAGLMPSIVEAMRLAGADFSDLEGIVVADGPGSFTGLRIGWSTSKGIQRECPSVALHTAPSLLCAAHGARFLGAGPVIAMFDALRGDVFAAAYSFEPNSVVCHVPPTLCRPEQLRERCPSTPATVVGDGALLFRDFIRAWTGRDPVGPPDFVPRAGSLLTLLAVDGATKSIADLALCEPDYGRMAEAQVKLEEAVRSGGVKNGSA